MYYLYVISLENTSTNKYNANFSYLHSTYLIKTYTTLFYNNFSNNIFFLNMSNLPDFSQTSSQLTNDLICNWAYLLL